MPRALFGQRYILRLAVAGLLFAANLAEAKCPFVKYVVHGRLALPSDVDVRHIRLVLFLEDSDHASAYPPAPGERDFSVPGTDGEFAITSYQSTASTFGCRAVRRSGDLILIGDEIRSLRIPVKFEASNGSILRDLTAQLYLPPLRVEKVDE